MYTFTFLIHRRSGILAGDNCSASSDTAPETSGAVRSSFLQNSCFRCPEPSRSLEDSEYSIEPLRGRVVAHSDNTLRWSSNGVAISEPEILNFFLVIHGRLLWMRRSGYPIPNWVRASVPF